VQDQEAAKLLAVMQLTWPHPEWTADQVRMWRSDLAKIEVGQATEALYELRGSEKFRPTFAAFLDRVQAIRRREALGRTALPGPSEPPVDRAKISELRERLSQMHKPGFTRGHDHHRGADNCPVCGGRT
jgi:hypothetical protein